MRRLLAPLCSCALLSSLPACEALSSMWGMASVMKQIAEHLETDLKSELTDAKIDKAIEVTPALHEFSKTASHKWDLDPDSPDFEKFASAMGAMSDYIAFFESHDTRLTEYYVDMVKISDARALIGLRRAHEEAMAKHDKERAELKAKHDAATGDDQRRLAEELDRNDKARKTLQDAFDDGQKAREKVRNQPGNSYSLSDDEVARVQARLTEIEAALKKPE